MIKISLRYLFYIELYRTDSLFFFQKNATIRIVDFTANNMGPTGAQFIGGMLSENVFITDLVNF